MTDEDWKTLMKALALHVQAIEFAPGVDLLTQHAITDHMMGVGDFIEAYPVPRFVKALSESLEHVNLKNEEYKGLLLEIEYMLAPHGSAHAKDIVSMIQEKLGLAEKSLCVICKAKPWKFSQRCAECYAALVKGKESLKKVCPSYFLSICGEMILCGLEPGHQGYHTSFIGESKYAWFVEDPV